MNRFATFTRRWAHTAVAQQRREAISRLPAAVSHPDASRERFLRDGYVCISGMFQAAEVDMLRSAIVADGDAGASNPIEMRDGTGRSSAMTLWQNIIPDTIYGQVAASERLLAHIRACLGGDVYHLHTKLMLKQPRSGGSWVVHQDFAYWYQAGAIDPHGMASCIVAVDAADEANGCLQFLPRSHHLGRLSHGVVGEQAGADADAAAECMRRLPVVVGTLQPGDILLTHSNLIHWSGPNTSDRWRRAMIVAYNRVDNPPVRGGMGVLPMPSPLPAAPVIRDDVCALGPRGLKDVSAAARAAATFLKHETNVEYVSSGRGK